MAYQDEDEFKSLPVMTLEELAKHTGKDGGAICIAVDGLVFDVTPAAKLYGPGGNYHVFAGRDATRALAVNSTKLTDVVDRPGDKSGLTASQLVALDGWLDTFEAKYKVIARLSSKGGKL